MLIANRQQPETIKKCFHKLVEKKKITFEKFYFPQNCYKTHFISFCLLTFTLATLELISCLYSVHQPSKKHDRYIIRENLLRLIRFLTLLVDSILWNWIIIYWLLLWKRTTIENICLLLIYFKYILKRIKYFSSKFITLHTIAFIT